MKKTLLILLLLPLTIFSIAQSSDFYFRGDDFKSSFSFDLNYEYGSNSITNNFLKTYLNGDYITTQDKEKMFARLNSHNRFGADQEGGISFITFPDTLAGSSDLGLFVKYNRYYHLDMSFTDDIIELYFDGNKRFAGKTADLGNSSLSLISYDQLQLGILTKFGYGKTKHIFGVGLSINNGYSNSRIEINKGSLLTEKNGEYIDFAADYSTFRSDTSKKGSNFFRGSGTSINIYYSFVSENKNKFDFRLTDLGFIRWVRNAQSFSNDTSFHFEGIQVNDILNIEDNIFANANADSVANSYLFADSSVAYTMLTPACLKASYLYNLNDKMRAEFSVKKKLFSNYEPYVMIKTQYLPDSRNIFSVNLGYGGYGGGLLENNYINVGVEYGRKFGKGTYLLLGTNYLNCFISPASATSQGAFFSIKKYFF